VLTGKPLGLGDLFEPGILVGMIGITLATGLLAGSYPALFLSSFKPAHILKQSSSSGSGGGAVFRRILVVVQFGLSVFLIIGTGVVYSQLEYMRDFDLGYEQEQLLRIRLREETQPSMDALEQKWEASPLVQAVTTARHLPTNIGSNSSGAEWAGMDRDTEILISLTAVDFDYAETLGIDILEGRDFSRAFPSDVRADTVGAWLINDKLARIMAKPDVIGEELSFNGVQGPIVGVMDDFHYNSLRADIMPLAMYLDPSAATYTILRVDGKRVSEALEFIETSWAEIVPDFPFEYWFLDENFDSLYREEARMSTLLSYFALVAILIACLGLVGLAAYTAQRRRKEISIRKVLGASHRSVSTLMVREFVILVAVANAVAWPVAYVVSRNWLEGFAYHTDLAPWLFVAAGIGSGLIALLTVGYHAVRAALEDPVIALRTE
jgi:ABC-type antimicrobial peptide transport system permease subunit